MKQTVSTLCHLQPATAVGQKALALAKRRYSMVFIFLIPIVFLQRELTHDDILVFGSGKDYQSR